MSPAKTPIQLFFEYATKGDTILNFVNDRATVEAYPSEFYIYESSTRILTIITDNVPQEHVEAIYGLIRDRFSVEGIIYKRANVKELDNYKNYKRENPYGNIIDFFEDKIPEEDVEALKMSLFMRSEKEKGKDIHKYKKAIRERFGERGTAIANLCNAGYFELEFMPFYNEVGFEEFDIFYELAVGKRARAIFVNSGMTFQAVYTAFLGMRTKCRKYEIKDFRIHAFGNGNVKLIKEVIVELSREEEGTFSFTFEESENPKGIKYDIIVL